ncbi:MAG TPA: hypothetical protein DEB39_07585 [Planctomycetaceae bacterium]|nr:hypothetical protein [Planctomycetaceae bacterium]
MAINVVCPGCLKRFQVSERFAGLKGPCPNCNTIIDIPKEQVKVHAPEDEAAAGKAVKGGATVRPLERIGRDFDIRRFYYAAGGTVLLLFLTAILGHIGLPVVVRNVLGALGLLAIGVPIAMYGYWTIRDREDLFLWSGRELYQRCAFCGGGYALLWIAMEIVSSYTGASSDPIYLWLFVLLFAGLSLILPHVVFDFDFTRGLAHYLTFFLATILLRALLGLGWLWNVVEKAAGALPPPPPV